MGTGRTAKPQGQRSRQTGQHDGQRRPSRVYRGRLKTGLLAVGLVTVAVVTASAIAVGVSVVGARRAQNSSVAAADEAAGVNHLLAYFVDQETAIRGYQLSRDKSYLQPYVSADTALPALERTLMRQLPTDERTLLAEVAAVHTTWVDQIAEPAMAGVVATAAVVAAGKSRFDAVRTSVETLQDSIGARQRSLNETAARAQRVAAIAGSGAILMLILLGLLVARVMVVWVLRPVGEVAAAARQVSQGDRLRQIPVAGPAEFIDLAADVDRMRADLLTLVAEAERSAEALRQQGVSVRAVREALKPTEDQIPGVRYAARIEPAEGILAGDWYDVLSLPGGRMGVVLGDVAGHGARAGVFALRVKYFLRSALLDGVGPADALTAVLEQLVNYPDDLQVQKGTLFATCVIVVVDPLQQRLTWANGGHADAYLLPSDEQAAPHRLDPTGPMLNAVFGPMVYDERSAQFGTGELLLLATDGITEARLAGQLVEYGPESLIEATSAARTAGDELAEQLTRTVDAVFEAVRDHAGRIRDDCTLIVAALEPTAVHSAPPSPN